MKKIKLFTLALAALFAGNVMAAEYLLDGNTSYSIPYTFEGSSVTIKADSRFEVEQKQMWNDKSVKSYGIKLANSANDNMDTAYIEISSLDELISGLELSASTNSTGAGKKYGVLYCSVAPFDKNYVISGEAQTSISKDLADASQVFSVPAGTMSIRIYRKVNYDKTPYGEGSSVYIYNYKITTTPAPKDDATLKSITIDGEALEGFDPATETYNVELPFGTTTVPTVAAVATSKKATAVVTPATAVPGATTIAVTAEDNTTTKTYTINFTTAASASTDATLSTITIDGKAIAGFKSDSMTYAYEVAYNYEAGKFPVVAAVANDESATIAYTQITAFPGKATILVTAQAGNILTYTIDITKATAPKILSEVVFSNGAKGASLNGVVRVPYLAGTEVPTVVSAVAADGATAVVAEDKNSITVTGEDNTTLVYTIETVELALATLGTEEVTFTGEETYIFDPYGWDASKGWKFAKSVEDAENHRVSEGRTRIYMALPAAKEVVLTSGSGGARGIKVYVNGVEKTEITSTAEGGKTITIALDSKNANFLAVESNQTKGDGGFTKIQLVPAGETAIDNAVVAEKAQKMIINGQLVIVKDGVRYNAQGVQL